MVKTAEAISIHQEVVCTAMDLARQLIRLGDNSNSRRRNEFCEGESEKKEGNKTKRRNSQEKAPRTFEKNSQGRDPRQETATNETARVGTRGPKKEVARKDSQVERKSWEKDTCSERREHEEERKRKKK